MLRKSDPFLSRLIPPVAIQMFKFSSRLGHLVALAAFFMQSEPPTFPMLEVVTDLHGYRSADSGEAVHHSADQRAVTQPD